MTRSLAVTLFDDAIMIVMVVVEVLLLVRFLKPRPHVNPFGEPPPRPYTMEDAVAATVRADALLKKTIGDSQWRKFKKTGFLEVVLKDIPLVTLVRIDGVGRCWAVGKQIGSEYMCVLPHTGEGLPVPDIILTMYLMAKYNPKKLLQTANWSHRHLV